jgi:hypothetical protein
MEKHIKNDENEDADAILRTETSEIEEELDNLGGYRDYIREQFRMSED